MSKTPQVVLDASAIERIVRRIAVAIVERTADCERLVLVGVRRGGVELAARLQNEIARQGSKRPQLGTVDIAFYRDDAATALPNPKIGPSELTMQIDGAEVVLVDDVLQTGRTIRAAIDCLHDHGRPRRIWLSVLCDRGGRELPIAPDFVGKVFELPRSARIDVVLGTDGPDRVTVTEAP
ncbi:MAG: bifunctional pyr operon transcriptional regulator/uracil phosphoribosyltransferase PyrR [Polyangiales bacterium]